MGGIIPFHDGHRRTQLLLPWFANGTLDPDESAMVKGHLDQCAECQEDLESNRALAAEVADISFDVDAGWAAVSARIRRPSRPRDEDLPWFRRPVPLGRAVAAQLAAAGLVGTLILTVGPGPSDVSEATYETLGAKVPPAGGNIVVLFEPGISLGEVRAALDGAGARITDGPTASGAYVISVEAAMRPRALSELREIESVLLAEPVDPAASQ